MESVLDLSSQKKVVLGFVALLLLAFLLASRPALAHESFTSVDMCVRVCKAKQMRKNYIRTYSNKCYCGMYHLKPRMLVVDNPQ